MAKQLRIFFTTSCLNTAMMALHAQANGGEYTDVLIIDRIPVRRSTVRVIEQTATLHAFDRIIDFSEEKDDNTGLEASVRKKLTRQLKTKPGFKQVYDLLYARLRKQQKDAWAKELVSAVPALKDAYASVRIFSQPMIRLLPSARTLFPEAPVTYLEHGLGDNLDVREKLREGDSFLALFGDELAIPNTETLQLDFSKYATEISTALPSAEQAFRDLPQGSWTLLATQPLEGFEVPLNYWNHFVSLMIPHLNHDSTVLIKPHPSQSMEVCHFIKSCIEQHGKTAIVWNNEAAKFINLELLFALNASRFDAVFSPFSSSVFYLSKLFPEHPAQFYYSMNSLLGFTNQTPALIRTRWKTLGNVIDKVFGANAIDIT